MSRIVAVFVLLLWGCGPAGPPGGEPAPVGTPPGEDLVPVTLVHLNDMYEITPVGGGRWGGPARVATLIDRLTKDNPDTFTLIAGDFLSPSALGTARVDGERLAGRQVVAVLNEMGLDYATFGNHEFDLDEDAFRARLGEARFGWFSSNVTQASGEPFEGVPTYRILEAGEGDRVARIGLIGLTYDGIRPDYVDFTPVLETARRMVDRLRDSVDVLVAVTHLQVPQDVALAEEVPELDLILGGHDHENLLLRRGADLTPIHKADANVRTVWVHRLLIDPRSHEFEIESELVEIDESIPEDPETRAVVEEWLDLGFAGFREDGFDPGAVVTVTDEPLDGLESSVRFRSTRLTALIAAAMRRAIDGAEVALLNTGSVRIDDVIPPGPVTQYDVIRVLPFGGSVLEVRMTGEMLTRVLDRGEANRGQGGFLESVGVARTAEDGWAVDGEPVQPDREYRLAVAAFLLTGREQGFDFLTRDAYGVTVVREGPDIRAALIAELRAVY